ncbi:MAG TPA: inositol monophosphatase family protein [Gaiellaceae bacterium]
MLTEPELDACAALMQELAVRAIERIVAERPRADQLATKSWAADWVTETDLAVERLVREAIAERFPDHRIEGEEYGVTGADDAPASWLIDPVDGTTNYVSGLPLSTFSLCVADEAGAAAALVGDPYRGEVLSAVRGRGAVRDGAPIHVSGAQTLMGTIVLTEYQAQSIWHGMAGVMQALAEAGCVTRIMGSNAFSISALAAGRCVATAIGGFNPEDCLGPALIAAEAGAVLPWGVPAKGERFLCAAPGVVDELLRLWPTA